MCAGGIVLATIMSKLMNVSVVQVRCKDVKKKVQRLEVWVHTILVELGERVEVDASGAYKRCHVKDLIENVISLKGYHQW